MDEREFFIEREERAKEEYKLRFEQVWDAYQTITSQVQAAKGSIAEIQNVMQIVPTLEMFEVLEVDEMERYVKDGETYLGLLNKYPDYLKGETSGQGQHAFPDLWEVSNAASTSQRATYIELSKHRLETKEQTERLEAKDKS